MSVGCLWDVCPENFLFGLIFVFLIYFLIWDLGFYPVPVLQDMVTSPMTDPPSSAALDIFPVPMRASPPPPVSGEAHAA